MPDDAPRQLAAIAAVTDDLDAILDRLFATVEQVKAILRAKAGQQPPNPEQEAP